MLGQLCDFQIADGSCLGHSAYSPIYMATPTCKKLCSLNIFLIPFDYLHKKVVLLEDLFSRHLLGLNFISLADVNEKPFNVQFPLHLSPRWCSEPVLHLFLLFKWGAGHSYSSQDHLIFDTHYVLEGSKDSVQSFFLVLNQWLHCFLSLHTHKQRRGEIPGSNSGQDGEIAVS